METARQLQLFDPERPRQKKRGHRLPDFLRPEEIELLIAEAKRLWLKTPLTRIAHFRSRHRDWLMWQVGLYMGLRVAELVGQKIEDVDFSAKPRATMLVHGKGSQDRCMPIPEQLVSPLRDWIDDRTSGPLFPSAHGHMSTRQAATRLKELAAVIPRRLHPHLLRHTFCTSLLRKGGKVRAVQRLMGHRSLSSTERYAHLLPGDLTETIDLLK